MKQRQKNRKKNSLHLGAFKYSSENMVPIQLGIIWKHFKNFFNVLIHLISFGRLLNMLNDLCIG